MRPNNKRYRLLTILGLTLTAVLLTTNAAEASLNCDTGCYAACGCGDNKCTSNKTCLYYPYKVPGTQKCNFLTGSYGACTPNSTGPYYRQIQPLPVATIDSSLGTNPHLPIPASDLALAQAAGIKWLRLDFNSDWDPNSIAIIGGGSTSLAAYADTARQYGIRLLVQLGCAADLGLCPTTSAQRSSFVEHAIKAMKSAAQKGILWELLNEPNSGSFFDGTDPANYYTLANELGAAINNNVPQEWYVGPALWNTNDDARSWLGEVLSHGTHLYFDAITVHPYNNNHPSGTRMPEQASPELSSLKSFVGQYTSAPTMVGEWGWSMQDSSTYGEQYPIPAREWLMDISLGYPLTVWYEWRSGRDGFGLLLRDGTPKRAYWGLRFVFSRLSGSTYVGPWHDTLNESEVYGYHFVSAAGKNLYVGFSDVYHVSRSFSVATGTYKIEAPDMTSTDLKICWPGDDTDCAEGMSSPPVINYYMASGSTISATPTSMPFIATQQ